jgi:hypothetical protein
VSAPVPAPQSEAPVVAASYRFFSVGCHNH